MTIQAISSGGAAFQMQAAVTKIQRDLADAQVSLSSGKPADYGLALGARTGLLETLQAQQNDLQTIQQTNAIATTRLDATNSALASMLSDIQNLASATLTNQPGTYSVTALQAQAQSALASLRSGLNTDVGGQTIFGGTNTDNPVMPTDPSQPGSAADTAFQASFQAQFGFSTASPSVANISASQIAGFLQTNMASLFDAANWKANWSSATDGALQSRVASDQTTATSLSANDPAFAQTAQAYSMVTQLPLANMNSSAVSAALAVVNSVANGAVQSMTEAQVKVGAMQASVTSANASLSQEATALTSSISAFDPVDPYATSTRISSLQTQLQMAYSLTAQLQHLSLAQYL